MIKLTEICTTLIVKNVKEIPGLPYRSMTDIGKVHVTVDNCIYLEFETISFSPGDSNTTIIELEGEAKVFVESFLKQNS